MQNTDWKLLWKVDKDDDDIEFSSPSSTTQLPRTHTDIVEDMLTQLTKVEGYSQILQEEFGGQHARDGRRIQTDSGDNDDLQTVVEKFTIDAEEKAPYVATDLSAHVVFVSESYFFLSYATDTQSTACIIKCTVIKFYAQDGESPLEAEPKKPKYYRVALEILTTERT